jgi:ADP-heptose:LPS heptosyltransferase
VSDIVLTETAQLVATSRHSGTTGDGSGERVPNVRRIAVLRGGGLGDFVFALPALDALRATYPDAEIVLLGRANIEPLVVGRPGPVDRFVRLPELSWLGGSQDGAEQQWAEREADEVFHALAAAGIDVAVQLHGGGRHSNPAVARLRPRVSAGPCTPDAAPLDRSIPYVYYQSEVMRDLEVASLVGATPVEIEPRYRGLRASDREAGWEALGGEPGRRPLVVIHPSAGDPRRRWPPESFAAVGDALVSRGASVAVVGTREEREIVAEVVGSMRGRAVDLAGRLDLLGLAGLLAEADLVVANDSGPLHLAAAVGAASVGIFWCGNLINAGPFTRARHRPVLSWRLDCPVCGVDCTRDSCRHTASFVADAPVEEAIDASVDLLEQEARTAAGVAGRHAVLPALS